MSETHKPDNPDHFNLSTPETVQKLDLHCQICHNNRFFISTTQKTIYATCDFCGRAHVYVTCTCGERQLVFLPE